MPYKNPDYRREYNRGWAKRNPKKFKEWERIYRKNNKDKISIKGKEYRSKNKERIKEYMKKYHIKNRYTISIKDKKRYEKNKDMIHQRQKEYYEKNKDRVYILNKRYYTINKDKINKQLVKRKENDIKFKMLCYLRTRITIALKRNCKSKQTQKLLGCSIQELKQHLEKQFTLGMNWKNYGFGWHIDHILPCSSFDLSKQEEQKKCFHYTNLQPLWATENLKKRDKII